MRKAHAYSGTVTAAMEAAIGDIPGLAVSLNTPEEHEGQRDYRAAAVYGRIVAQQVIENDLPKNTLLNVNVPYLPQEEIKGIKVTRQGLRVYRDELVERKDPRGIPYYWIGGEAPGGVPEDGTDFGALAGGFVSVTPLHLDLTAYEMQSEIQT